LYVQRLTDFHAHKIDQYVPCFLKSTFAVTLRYMALLRLCSTPAPVDRPGDPIQVRLWMEGVPIARFPVQQDRGWNHEDSQKWVSSCGEGCCQAQAQLDEQGADSVPANQQGDDLRIRRASLYDCQHEPAQRR
jgi:hypothetical protein